MEIDVDNVDLGRGSSPRSADVCVIGGGIAGLLLAHKLAEAGVDVLLLEAGGKRPVTTDEGNAQVVRALGGTSLAWGGQLLPVHDAEGWPVSSAELAAYVPELERLLGVDALPYEAPRFFDALGTALPGILKQTPLLVPRLSKFAPFRRRNLAKTLGRALLRHSRARIALQAQAMRVEGGPGDARLREVVVRTRSGVERRVRANTVVIAAGTVETCGLLLRSSAALETRLGEAWKLVGRNVHNHLTVRAATFTGRARRAVLLRYQPWLVGGVRGTVHSVKLEPGGRLRARLGFPFGMAHFIFEEPENGGLGMLRGLLRARQAGGRVDALTAMRALPRSLRELSALHRLATEEQRRFVSSRAAVSLRLNIAQQQSMQSRVRLREGRAEVTWHSSANDLRGLRAFAAAMQEHLSQLGCSEIEGAEWNPSLLQDAGPIAELEDARHAMGGAVMGADVRLSVVNAQLKVHGVENLYVASAAVLPDGRAQLPTLTVMALALRLADSLIAARQQLSA